MSDLNSFEVPHNTPSARSALVNAPAWADGLTFETFLAFSGAPAPAPLFSWLPNSCFHPSGLMLFGHSGTGKTGLGICALRALAAAGFSRHPNAHATFYWNMVAGMALPDRKRVAELFPEQRPVLPSPCWFLSWPKFVGSQRPTGLLSDSMNWFDVLSERISALMLDDVSMDVGTPFRESLLLQHMEWAAEAPGRALILTCNAAPSQWAEMFGERISERLLDDKRFLLVKFSGGSLR